MNIIFNAHCQCKGMATSMLKSNSYVPIDTTCNLIRIVETGENKSYIPNDTTEVSIGDDFCSNQISPCKKELLFPVVLSEFYTQISL